MFCHRADQFRYDTVPSCRRTAKATGLQESTVSTCDQRLLEHGLITPEKSVIDPCPRLNWFQPLDSLKKQNPDGPSFQWLRNWKTLIRQPGDNPLSITAVLVYSVIRHSAETKWKPPQGWTHEYLGLLTATNPKTVAAALATLEENGFLRVLEGMRFQLYRLRDSQVACFADRKAWSGNSSEPDDFLDEYGPGSDRLEERHAARVKLDKFLEGWPIPNNAPAAIRAEVMKREGWEQNWECWANKLLDNYLG